MASSIIERNLFPTATIAISTDRVLRAFTWCAVVICCFILTHPYGGIVHDNLLYLVQALLRLKPEIYGGDAFFQWGSQDRYTLFSPIYAWLIVRLGVDHATVGLLLIAQALFVSASFVLVRALVPRGLRGYAMLFIVCTIGIYGGRLLFRLAEPYVTPRAFVEAATLVAIALLISGRRVWSFILLAAATLLHPLMAIAGMMYCWIYLVIQDKRWWWMLGLAAIPGAAGWAGIAPFDQLFETIDEKWLGILVEDNGNLFLTLWTHFDWAMVAFDAAVLWISLNIAEGVTRRALQAALTVAAVSLCTTFLVADVMHNVLLTAIQPWRALWIVHWMAAAAIPFVLAWLWRSGSTARLIAGLLAFGFVTRGLPTSMVASGIAVALYHYRHRVTMSIWVLYTALFALAAGAFVSWLQIALRVYQFASGSSDSPIEDFIVRALSKPLPLLVLAIGLVWFGLIRCRQAYVAAFLSIGLLIAAINLWDQRTPFWRFIESVGLGAHPFSQIVKPNQEVLWYGSATAPWIMMQRRSYFSDNQKSGQMFSREMAIELNRRKSAIATLSIQEDLCKLMNGLNSRNDSCEPDLDILRTLCEEAGNLDFIVLETRVATRWVASWTLPSASRARRPYYYLYECKSLTKS